MRDSAQEIGRNGDPWCIRSFTRPFCMALCSFGPPPPPCTGGYYLDNGAMPLHDAIGINCKNGITTENQGTGVKYMG